MRQRMDLAEAAARLETHRHQWLAAGLRVSPVLWGEDGDRVGAQVASPGWRVELVVEVHHGGWAHIHFVSDSQGLAEGHRVRSLDEWSSLLDEAAVRASRVRLLPARLLANSCTTGWLDWIHGELWLLPDALVRVRSGFMATVVNSLGGAGVTAPDPYRLAAYDPEAVLTGHRTNKLIPLADIAQARLHGGITTSGMAVRMTDGTRHKLLWMSHEPARRLLRERLLVVLGARLSY
ncbi:hypothetical protein [Streptomyces sp. NPDC002845]